MKNERFMTIQGACDMKITENKFYDYTPPVKPAIRRLGTIKCDVVEATPFVFHDRLYRLEYFREGRQNAVNPGDGTYLHVYDVQTAYEFAPFAFGHHLGSAFADGGFVYAVAAAEAPGGGKYGTWGAQTLHVFRTSDLDHWEQWGQLDIPDNFAFNSNICRKDGVYTMLIECALPVQFCFRFAQSRDLKTWTLLPEDHLFQKDRYSGGPAIYTLPDDPYYYVFYLEANPGPRYTNCVARSADLVNWEYSPCNPVLAFDPDEDKKIANPYLTPEERARIARAWDINNSDMECCEFLGRTIIYYSWGCQRGIEFLAEACYEGTMKEFLQGFFE